jgi:hypothetical protein
MLRAALIPLLFALALPSARALVLSPDFDGPAWPDSLVPTLPEGFGASVGGGELIMDFSYDGAAGPRSQAAGVRWLQAIPGDFVLTMTVDVSGLPESPSPSLFVNGGPLIGMGGPGGYMAFTGAWRAGANAEVNGAVFVPDYVGSPVFTVAGHRVQVRVERSGDTVVQAVAPEGSASFLTLYTASGAGFLGQADVVFDLFYGGSDPVSDARIRFSEVQLQLPAVPEPGAAALLALGLAALTLRRSSFSRYS